MDDIPSDGHALNERARGHAVEDAFDRAPADATHGGRPFSFQHH
jgi:hypothetical protein